MEHSDFLLFLKDIENIFDDTLLKISIMKLKNDLTQYEKNVINNFEYSIFCNKNDIKYLSGLEFKLEQINIEILINILEHLKNIALRYQKNAQIVIFTLYREQ